MAASRDYVDEARPASGQRPHSNSAAGSGMPSRPHAHSVSLGTLHPAYRVNRRKSSSSMHGLNVGALAAAAKDAPVDANGRVKAEHVESLGKSPLSRSNGFDAKDGRQSKTSSALVDGPPLSSMAEKPGKGGRRRASEGTRLTRERRRSTAAGELRCEKCGKGYKHGSCLQKHKWEHTPEWALTSKLLISKHQQVQLLEAAQVLVNMNVDPKEAASVTESAIQESESSDSPAASGMSDAHEDDISSRTSTPSQHEDKYKPSRHDSYNSAYSRSYQSTSGHSFAPSSTPGDASELYYYQQAGQGRRRRLSQASSYVGEGEERDLTAAAESLLSCSLGTPKSGAAQLPPDVPPVPPLPAQFQPSRPTSHGYQADVEMTDPERRRRHVHDDEDVGVFGQMEH